MRPIHKKPKKSEWVIRMLPLMRCGETRILTLCIILWTWLGRFLHCTMMLVFEREREREQGTHQPNDWPSCFIGNRWLALVHEKWKWSGTSHTDVILLEYLWTLFTAKPSEMRVHIVSTHSIFSIAVRVSCQFSKMPFTESKYTSVVKASWATSGLLHLSKSYCVLKLCELVSIFRF